MISRVNVSHLNELYDFFKLHRLNVKLNPILKSANSAKYFYGIGISSREYGDALKDLFDKWWDEKEEFIKIEPFFYVIVIVPSLLTYQEVLIPNQIFANRPILFFTY